MKRLLAFFALVPGLAFADVAYTLKPDTAARSIRVSVTLPDAGETEELRIPAWCPGFYFIQNYQNKISDVRATDPSGRPLKVSKPGARAWRIDNPAKSPVTLSYRVLGDDGGLGFFGVNVRPHTAFVNGPAAFMYSPSRLQEPTTLRIELPQGWNVATGMSSSEDGVLRSGGYDEMIDHPIQIGHFEKRTFTIDGLAFEAVYVSPNQRYAANLDQETETLRRLTIPALKMMGGAPFKRYVYLIHLATGDFSGGLEHRASTVLAIDNSPSLALGTLATHEFFHVWNVKHIRPKVLGPFDYTQPVRTGNLWFAEGVTDYYAYIHAYRSGLYDADWLLREMTHAVRELQAGQMRKRVTLEQSSTRAWENGGFGVGDLSYYNKGLVAGLLFDAAIRGGTGGTKSLDDVFRLMMGRHKLPQPGYDEDGILRTLNEVSGRDMAALYNTIVRSTAEMPYEVLSSIGLRLRGGGVAAPAVGFGVAEGVVETITPALEEMGLRIRDRILSVNGQQFQDGALARLKADEAYRVVVDRGGEQVELSLRVLSATGGPLTIERDPFASAEAKARLAQWLDR